MTTIAAGPLSDTLQALVDARLDTIDRMLLGRVNRQDRLAIVREVESQIFDLLQRSNPETLDRDDVLAVLARLDPPEAYLPDESADEPGPARLPTASRTLPPSRTEPSRLPLASGVLGMVATFLLLFSIVVVLGDGFGLEELAYIVMFGSIFIAFVASIIAVVFAVRVKLRGGWALTGFVTGILSLITSCVGGLTLMLMIL